MIQINYIFSTRHRLSFQGTNHTPLLDFGLGTEPELDHIFRAPEPRDRPRVSLITLTSWTFNLSTITTAEKYFNDRVTKDRACQK